MFCQDICTLYQRCLPFCCAAIDKCSHRIFPVALTLFAVGLLLSWQSKWRRECRDYGVPLIGTGRNSGIGGKEKKINEAVHNQISRAQSVLRNDRRRSMKQASVDSERLSKFMEATNSDEIKSCGSLMISRRRMLSMTVKVKKVK